MLTRILEPEVMDTAEDAHEYDAMDHAAVNAQFVTDLLAVRLRTTAVSDILASPRPRRRHRANPDRAVPAACRTIHITAVDAAESMLALARQNIAAAGFDDRIELVLADAKALAVRIGVVSRRHQQQHRPPHRRAARA